MFYTLTLWLVSFDQICKPLCLGHIFTLWSGIWALYRYYIDLKVIVSLCRMHFNSSSLFSQDLEILIACPTSNHYQHDLPGSCVNPIVGIKALILLCCCTIIIHLATIFHVNLVWFMQSTPLLGLRLWYCCFVVLLHSYNSHEKYWYFEPWCGNSILATIQQWSW